MLTPDNGLHTKTMALTRLMYYSGKILMINL